MQPFQMCVALGPLGLFFLCVGVMNLSRHPWVVSGARETAALGLALCGWAVVGPMQLFMPEEAAVRFHGYVWVLLLAFYSLCFQLWILLARPRLVIYNLSAEELRPILQQLGPKLDSDAQWAGDHLLLPNRGVQLEIEEFAAMRNLTLVAASRGQSYSGWRQFEFALRGALRQMEVGPNRRALSLLFCGLLILIALSIGAWKNPQAIAQGFFELLQR
jgi:hypothetical protein